MKNQKLNLKNLEATLKIPSFTYVPLEQVNNAEEHRLYFEVFLSVGLTLIGVVLSNFNSTLLIVGIISLGIAIFFIIRYILKYKDLEKKI